MQTTFRHNFMHCYEQNAEKSLELMFCYNNKPHPGWDFTLSWVGWGLITALWLHVLLSQTCSALRSLWKNWVLAQGFSLATRRSYVSTEMQGALREGWGNSLDRRGLKASLVLCTTQKNGVGRGWESVLLCEGLNTECSALCWSAGVSVPACTSRPVAQEPAWG